MNTPENRFHMPETIHFDNVMKLKQLGEKHILSAGNTMEKIYCDLSTVKHCDSSALALLIGWKRYAKNQKVDLIFMHTPPILVSLAGLSHVQSLLLN